MTKLTVFRSISALPTSTQSYCWSSGSLTTVITTLGEREEDKEGERRKGRKEAGEEWRKGRNEVRKGGRGQEKSGGRGGMR